MIKEQHIFILVGTYLVSTWVAVFLIDVRQVLGVREIYLWPQLFANGKPTEWLQFYLLGATALVAAYVAGRCLDDPQPDVRGQGLFWMVMGVALVLMLVEDAAELRHRIREFVLLATRSSADLLDRLIELAYFAVLASVPLYALLRYGRYLLPLPRTLAFVLAGFALYAVAALSSASRNWGTYEAAGTRILDALDMEVPVGMVMTREELGYFFVDAVLEETVETLGAMFLLAAALSYYRWMRRGGIR